MTIRGAKGATAAVAFACLLAGCSLLRNQRSQGAERCSRAGALLGDAFELRTDGYLGRSLERVELAVALCPSLKAQRVLAETLADVGLTDDAIAAYRLLAESGGSDDQQLAAAAIAKLEKRPPPTRSASDDDRALAVELYRDGVNQRLERDYEASLLQLRRSYALWPDALTIVQIGLTHDSAQRPVDARRAFARALAIAETTAGVPAEPRTGGTTDRSVAVAVAGRTKLIVSLDSGGVLEVWDGISGQPRQSFVVDVDVDQIAVSPDGSLVALGSSWNRSIDILRVSTGRVSTPTAAGVDVHVWDAAGGGEVGSLSLHEDGLRSLAFGDDGVHAAVASGAYGAVAISADGTRRAVAAHNGTIEYAGPDGELTVAPPDGAVALSFRRDGEQLAAVTPSAVIAYDTSTGGEVSRAGVCAGSTSVAHVGGESRVVCTTAAGLRFYDVDTGESVAVIRGRRPIVSAAFAGDEDAIDLWIAAADGNVAQVRAPSGEPGDAQQPGTGFDTAAVAAVVGSVDGIVAAAIHPTRPLLVMSDGQTVTLRDTGTGAIVEQLEGGARRLAFSADGERLVWVQQRKVTVRPIDAANRKDVRVIDESDDIVWVDVNRDATLALVVRTDGLATLWDVAERNALATLAGTYDGSWVVMDPSGRVEGAGGDELAQDQLYWKVGESQLPGFVGWQRNYHQDLLSSILGPQQARSFGDKTVWYSEESFSPKIAIPVGVVGLGFEIYNIVQVVQGELANPWVGLVQVGFWGALMWEAGHGCGKSGHWACSALGVLSGMFATYGLYSFVLGIDAFEASSESAARPALTTPTTIGYGRAF